MENDNPLAFLDKPAPDNTPAPAPEAPAVQEAAPASPEQPRNADGTFAAKEADGAPAEAPPAAETPRQPPLSEKEVTGFYKAMQDERDKRQALERENAELKAKAAPAEPLTPDEQAVAADYRRSFAISRKFAVKDLGEDGAAELQVWAETRCAADPAFNARMLSSDDPFEDARSARDAEKVLGKFKASDLADYDDFAAWKAAKAAGRTASPQPSAPSVEVPPPKSLATAPGTGSRGAAHVEVGDKAPFNAVFGA